MIVDDDIAKALRGVFPPQGETAPPRDLWPDVARRISAPPPAAARWEWALAGLAALWLLAFPQGALALLYLL